MNLKCQKIGFATSSQNNGATIEIRPKIYVPTISSES